MEPIALFLGDGHLILLLCFDVIHLIAINGTQTILLYVSVHLFGGGQTRHLGFQAHFLGLQGAELRLLVRQGFVHLGETDVAGDEITHQGNRHSGNSEVDQQAEQRLTVGAAAGTLVQFNTEGIDFALTALFVTVLTEQWLSTDRHTPALVGLGVTLGCLLVFGSEQFLIPAMLVIALLLCLYTGKRDRKEDGSHE